MLCEEGKMSVYVCLCVYVCVFYFVFYIYENISTFNVFEWAKVLYL